MTDYRSSAAAAVRAGQLRLSPGRRPDQPQHRLPGRQPADGSQTGLIRVDATDDLGRPLPWSPTPTTPTTAGTGSWQLHRPGHAVDRPNDLGRCSAASYLNFIRNPRTRSWPTRPCTSSTLSQFTNNGAGVEWIPFDIGGTDQHRVVTMVDPTTGLPRLIFGDDQGVFSVLDNNGTFDTDRHRHGRRGRRQPQRQPPDHPVLLRGGPAQQRWPPRSPAPCSTAGPGQRRPGLRPPTS